MKKLGAVLILLALFAPAVFCAAAKAAPAVHDDYGYSGQTFVTAAYAIKVLLVLAVMAGFAFAASKLMKKYNISPGAFNQDIKVISIKQLAGDKKAALIEARGREYLVGISKDSMVVMDKFDIVREKRKK
jgi:flagellar biogenesis protein FliO